MLVSVSIRHMFARAVAVPEEDIDLGTVALLIAKEEYADLDVRAYVARLDDMAAKVRPAAGALGDPRRIVEAVNAFLFEREGFRGNAGEYYDPRNSFLNDVLDRKLGIPITLSLVYMEVGRRIGFPMAGIGMPGHFLLKPSVGRAEWYIDAFNRGQVLTVEECAQRVQSLYQGRVPFRPEFLATINKRQFLYRMLANLKAIYLGQKDLPRGIGAIERMLALNPDNPEDVRDRGLVLAQAGQYTQATAALERYLKLSPQADDAEPVKEAIETIWRMMAGLN